MEMYPCKRLGASLAMQGLQSRVSWRCWYPPQVEKHPIVFIIPQTFVLCPVGFEPKRLNGNASQSFASENYCRVGSAAATCLGFPGPLHRCRSTSTQPLVHSPCPLLARTCGQKSLSLLWAKNRTTNHRVDMLVWV